MDIHVEAFSDIHILFLLSFMMFPSEVPQVKQIAAPAEAAEFSPALDLFHCFLGKSSPLKRPNYSV